MTEARTQVRTPARPAPQPPADRRPAEPRRRPDPNPSRIAIGMTGVAVASAIAAAVLAPQGTAAVAQTSTPAVQGAAQVRHVVKYVQLQPGQTAPPQAVVQQAPAPTPRVVVVATRQSGLP